jgi:hypothetical protein
VGLVRLGALDEGACQVGEELLVGGDQAQAAREARGPRGGSHALGDPLAGRLRRDLLPDGGPVVWPGGARDTGAGLSTCAPQVGAAAPQGAGRAPLRGLGRGVGTPATAPSRRALVGRERVVCGVAPLARWHREGRPPDAGHAFWGPAVGQPSPRAETLDRHHQAVTSGRPGLEEGCGRGGPLAVSKQISIAAHEAPGHGAGVHVEAAVNAAWRGVKAPEVSSSVGGGDLPRASRPPRDAEEGASSSITGLEPTAYSVRSAPASGSGSGPALDHSTPM